MTAQDIFGSRDRPLITFNFVDFARGLAVETFYGGNLQTISGQTLVTNYLFNNRVFEPITNSTTKTRDPTGTETTYTQTHIANVDLKFGLPRTINGDIIMEGAGVVTASGGVSSYWEYNFCKVKNEVETLIISGMTLVGSFNNKTTFNNQKFKGNEILRLKIFAWTKYIGSSSNDKIYMTLYHNPLSTDRSNYLLLQIPFKIDI